MRGAGRSGGHHGGHMPPPGPHHGGGHMPPPGAHHGGGHMPPPGSHHRSYGRYGGGCLGCCMYVIGAAALFILVLAMIF